MEFYDDLHPYPPQQLYRLNSIIDSHRHMLMYRRLYDLLTLSVGRPAVLHLNPYHQLNRFHASIDSMISRIYDLFQLVDLLFFICILIVFILAYGVVAQALSFPNADFTPKLIVDAIYYPYWQIYGEIFMEQIEGFID